MKFLALFFGLLVVLVLGLPVKTRDDEPSPDVTALEYGRLVAKTVKARVVPSSDATAIEYGLIAAARTDSGPRDNGLIHSNKPRADDVARLQDVSESDSEWTKRDVKYPILNKRPIIIIDKTGQQGPEMEEVSDPTAIEYAKTKSRRASVEYAQHRSPIESRAIIEPNNILGRRSHVTVNREREGGAGIVKRPTAVEYATLKSSADEATDTTGWTRKKLKSRQDEPDATAIEYALDSTPDTTGWGKTKVKTRQEEPDASMVEYALESTPDSGSWGRARRRQDGTAHGDGKRTNCAQCHGTT